MVVLECVFGVLAGGGRRACGELLGKPLYKMFHVGGFTRANSPVAAAWSRGQQAYAQLEGGDRPERW